MISGILEVTQASFNDAEAELIAILRAGYPDMDLRRGTAVRDLLVRPAATVHASSTATMARLRSGMSLAGLDDDSDPESADATLAQFGVERAEGGLAQGLVLVVVDTRRRYSLASGIGFEAENGIKFATVSTTTVESEDLVDAGSDRFSFTVAVVATEPGGAGNVAAGVAMDPVSPIFGLISSESASDFSGGSDTETPSQAAARVPAALSARSLMSRVSAFATIKAAFGDTVSDLGAVGFGDPAQVRGRANALGLTRPGVVDLYPRTFRSPVVTVLEKTGTWVAENTYRFSVSASDAPGFQRLKSVFDAGTSVVGSYDFAVDYGYSVPGSGHWIVSSSDAANTVWRTASVTVTGVPYTDPEIEFGVEVYAPPQMLAIQNWLDSDAVRNLGADVVARSPFIVLTSVGIPALGAEFDAEALKLAVSERINGFGFRGKLSRSDIVDTVLGFVDVGLGASGLSISGSVIGSDGVELTMSGDVLDLAGLEAWDRMIHRDTTVFVCEPELITVA